jgi:hypothetical protein
MVQVVIQPSYGNSNARRHWHDTLDREVDYLSSKRFSTLSETQKASLRLLHPSGSARFWGATSKHDRRMATLQTGDVVLFTGKRQVRAIGEVGYSFVNEAFAMTMWQPDKKRGDYNNVYSLLSFQRTSIDYEEIWELPGFNDGDNFMGLRFLDPAKGFSVLEGLRIDTLTAARSAADQERQVASKLTSGSRVVGVEAVNSPASSYERARSTVLVHRAEALLVQRYRDTLGGAHTARIRTPSGVTDLLVTRGDSVEIVEAKRSAGHTFVRDALGQLLDYVANSSQTVTHLAGLFPDRPTDADVDLLHRYGIDCIYQRELDVFDRLSATQAQRNRMLQIWQS